MANEKRLIDANALEEKFRITKIIEVFPEWEELSFQTKHKLVQYGKTIKMFVQDAPTVDAVEVVHGRWALIKEGQNTSVYQCSKCKRMVNVVCDRNLRERQLAKNYPYCNCGAKMDGDGNG
jgi:hypothetical protein